MTTVTNQRITVLYGGWSSEREVSLRSGKNVYEALVTLGHTVQLLDVTALEDLGDLDTDLVFMALHGGAGEDGTVQAYLEKKGIPYTGSGPKACALAMDKMASKRVFLEHDIPTPEHAKNLEDLRNLQLPIVKKPRSEGSSRGVQFITDPEALSTLTEDNACLYETFIEGQEITVGLIEVQNDLMVLPILELVPKNKFYDFEAKYTKGMTDFIIPARLSEELSRRCETLAKRVHRVLGCRGLSRVDMRVHPEKGPFVLELNTIPGLTELSDLPAQAKAAGYDFPELITMILGAACIKR